ncbi:MAG TPA: hypothetical protein VF587_18905 [Solirubrobacteraceae bacterium]|jgi:hypothetical protein
MFKTAQKLVTGTVGGVVKTVTGAGDGREEAARKAAETRRQNDAKRSQAAQKAAQTRKAAAAKRSATAKKASRTRKQRDDRVAAMVEATKRD